MKRTYRYDRGAGKVVEVSGHEVASEAPNVKAFADRHFVSHQLPRNYKHAERFDKEGRPAFTSMREVREMVSRARDAGEQISYDAS